jgi:hypothetical protein
VSWSGYAAAWRFAAGCLLAAVLLMLVGRRMARRAWLPAAGSAARAAGHAGAEDPAPAGPDLAPRPR